MLAESRESLESLLGAWGRFWAYRERGSGHHSVSIEWIMMEAKRLGLHSRGTKYMYDLADEIHVPEWVAAVDERVALLPVPARLALRARYVAHGNALDAARRFGMSRKKYSYWIGIAHRELLVN